MNIIRILMVFFCWTDDSDSFNPAKAFIKKGKLMKMNTIRKRGADMTQALLYAAFAIIVLISVLAMYQVVTMSNNKATASRTMSMLTMETQSLFKGRSITVLELTPTLIQAGAVPTDAIGPNDTIKLPYGGAVYIGTGIGGHFGNFYNYTIRFDNESRNAKALCTYLSAGIGPNEIIDSGPLGAEYTLSGGEMGSCSEGEMGFSAQFPR